MGFDERYDVAGLLCNITYRNRRKGSFAKVQREDVGKKTAGSNGFLFQIGYIQQVLKGAITSKRLCGQWLYQYLFHCKISLPVASSGIYKL